MRPHRVEVNRLRSFLCPYFSRSSIIGGDITIRGEHVANAASDPNRVYSARAPGLSGQRGYLRSRRRVDTMASPDIGASSMRAGYDIPL
jgi:hypothetical protein